MVLQKTFYIVAVAIAFCLAAFVTTLVPLLCVLLGFVPFSTGISLFAGYFFFFVPFGLMWYVHTVRAFVRTEVELLQRVGQDQLLWTTIGSGAFAGVTDDVVFERQSLDGGSPEAFEVENWKEISRTYAWFITHLSKVVLPGEFVQASFLVCFALWVRWSVKLQLKAVYLVLWTSLAVCAVLVMSPASVSHTVLSVILRYIWYLTPTGWPAARVRLEWLRLYFVRFAVECALLATALNSEMERHYSERLASRRRTVASNLRRVIMKSATFISDIRLPAFVRNRFQSVVDKNDLIKGRDILADLGWPVNVDVVDEPPRDDPIPLVPNAAESFVANTSFATGIRQLKLEIEQGLQHLTQVAPAYYRTEEYKDVYNELKATARYFQERDVKIDVDVYDDVWRVVRPIFQNSRLTAFNQIISLWNKKYAVGFWMTDESGRRKLSRKSFINKVGYARFKRLWANTFVRATEIMPVAHISVKDEALSPAKFLANKVRSIVGSPISHYIGSTIFSHGANHNFQWESTPVKIGMPTNGYWMGKVFENHARFSVHMEGDFSEFDSTIEGPVKDIIRAVRKRGFENHKDSKEIAALIDGMYDQLDQQFLGHTSTGQVFRKWGGLTTGHSSTSMDNSVACIVFYMAAWRSLTGLSAKEFLHFNELSVYGDDHMLSVHALAPRVWTQRNIQQCMAKWGVVNKLEVKKFRDMTFLTKHCMNATPALRAELDAAGLSHVRKAVWHDKEKLIGKLTSKPKKFAATYRATRLYSYLHLTAHHRDIYDAIVTELKHPMFYDFVIGTWKKIPTYEEVLIRWYNPTPGPAPVADDTDELWVEDGKMLIVGSPSMMDHLLQALAVVPDLLNPSLFNHGPSRTIQMGLATHLSWVVDFMRQSNDIGATINADFYLRRTPYSFIDPLIVGPSAIADSWTTNLVRHWLFLFYYNNRPLPRNIAVFDFVARKMANFNFVISGRVAVESVRDVFPFDLLLVAALLDALPDLRPMLDFIKLFPLPDLHSWIDIVWNRCMVFLWTSVPANFNEVNPLLAALRPGHGPLVIRAPTGVGKSTALVAHIAASQRCPHRKLIVIEPRSMLVVGLSTYVGQTFGLSTSGSTRDLELDQQAQVWFMTPQSFLAQLHLVKREDLIFLDEAHLQEPVYPLLLRMLPRWNFRVVAATATPSEALIDMASNVVDIPIAQVFSVRNQKESVDSVADYIPRAVAIANQFPSSVKVLVIVDTPEEADRAALLLSASSQSLSSKHPPVIKDVARYVGTSVVDVGITIPGLEVVISPNWTYSGGGVRVEADALTLTQRKGRTGRTNNGIFFLVSAPGPFTPFVPPTPEDGWRAVLSSGISPSLGFKAEPEAMCRLFGISPTGDTEMASFERASAMFTTNLQILQALSLKNADFTSDVGGPANLVTAAKRGQFSANLPRDLASFDTSAFSALRELLAALAKGETSAPSVMEWAASLPAGPLFDVSHIISGVLNNAKGFIPELPGLAHIYENPDVDGEIANIHKLLDLMEAPDGTFDPSLYPFRIPLEGPVFPLRTQTV